MASCTPIIITDIGSAEWDRLRLAAANRLGLAADVTGTYTGHGFTVSWMYVPDALTVTPLEVPIDCGFFESLLRHGIATI